LKKIKSKASKIATEEITYPCPHCGTYNLPYMHNRKGFAMMRCGKCQHQYKTSTAVSANFRKFCSKVGSAPNRSPSYYTSHEKIVKDFLEKRGQIEGLDFHHNARVKDGNLPVPQPFINSQGKKRVAKYVYFWLDFVVPEKRLVIEASPSIWHKMWNREVADIKKEEFLKNLGWKLISLDEKDLNQLNKKRTEGKILGLKINPNSKPYKRTSNCKRMDEIFGKPEKGSEISKKVDPNDKQTR